jgi:hypothetical protein
MLMRSCLTILFLTLLSLAATPCSAQNGRYSTEVRVSANVVDENFLTLTVETDMRLPTTYNIYQGRLTSEDGTNVMNGGKPGTDAYIRITGPAYADYSLSFAERGVLIDENNHTLYLDFTMGTGNGPKTPRKLDGKGEDVALIMGSTTLDGLQPIGYYTNTSSPLIVTATVN